MREVLVRYGTIERIETLNTLKYRIGFIARSLCPYIESATLSKVLIIKFVNLKGGLSYNVYRVINERVYAVRPLFPTYRRYLAALTLQRFIRPRCPLARFS